MNRRSKILVAVTIVLFFALVIKSNFFDEVDVMGGDGEKYKDYLLQSAPLGLEILDKTGLVTYRVVRVKMENEEGHTEIIYKDENEMLQTEVLDGEYTGRVRAYLLNFIPVTDINIKGGIVTDGD